MVKRKTSQNNFSDRPNKKKGSGEKSKTTEAK
jgi:hypothetical protein